ncbi:MAG TPA: GNAT family protein [Dehalococcoidia bacterium]|nr:GNAT family protein [Dehalococcoidia bacterium]
MNAPVLAGKAVRLRPLREDDLALVQRWFNDPAVRYWLHQSDRPDATPETVRNHFWGPVEQGRAVAWMIETAGTPVGTLRLVEIDSHHRRAELAISIGEPDHWGRGLGTDAIQRALQFAFGDLGLRRVSLITDADNARGIRCYEKCGFVREGVLRAHRLRHGQPLDMLTMAVLKEDWLRANA